MQRNYEKVPKENDVQFERRAETQAKEELIAYILGEIEEGNDLLSLAELTERYVTRLHDLEDTLPQVNKMRLKNYIFERLSHLELTEHTIGRNVYFYGSKTKEEMLRERIEVKKHDLSKKYSVLAEAVTIIRNETVDHHVDGKFDIKSNANIPAFLQFFVGLVLEGRKAIEFLALSTQHMTRCQLLLFNMKYLPGKTYNLEPPLPSYLA